MDKIRIRGGRPLRGSLAVGGAKNAALPILASALLANGVHLMGRRLYQTMLYWETADQDPSADEDLPIGVKWIEFLNLPLEIVMSFSPKPRPSVNLASCLLLTRAVRLRLGELVGVTSS